MRPLARLMTPNWGLPSTSQSALTGSAFQTAAEVAKLTINAPSMSALENVFRVFIFFLLTSPVVDDAAFVIAF